MPCVGIRFATMPAGSLSAMAIIPGTSRDLSLRERDFGCSQTPEIARALMNGVSVISTTYAINPASSGWEGYLSAVSQHASTSQRTLQDNATSWSAWPGEDTRRKTATLRMGIRNAATDQKMSVPCGAPSVDRTMRVYPQNRKLQARATIFIAAFQDVTPCRLTVSRERTERSTSPAGVHRGYRSTCVDVSISVA